mmetsp:Transcript_13257/g.41953  ORF Transcript_13257/g.41953 Transcript_13257/m.41953 type:complete len:303 (+) Transcript_13257:123-1031(+)
MVGSRSIVPSGRAERSAPRTSSMTTRAAATAEALLLPAARTRSATPAPSAGLALATHAPWFSWNSAAWAARKASRRPPSAVEEPPPPSLPRPALRPGAFKSRYAERVTRATLCSPRRSASTAAAASVAHLTAGWQRARISSGTSSRPMTPEWGGSTTAEGGGRPNSARPARRRVPASRAKTPTVSKDCAIGTTPSTATAPWVVRSPRIPQHEAGTRTLPPVSVPRAKSTAPAATATAEPLEEPPGMQPGAAGLMTSPYCSLTPSMLCTASPARGSQPARTGRESHTHSSKSYPNDPYERPFH